MNNTVHLCEIIKNKLLEIFYCHLIVIHFGLKIFRSHKGTKAKNVFTISNNVHYNEDNAVNIFQISKLDYNSYRQEKKLLV